MSEASQKEAKPFVRSPETTALVEAFGALGPGEEVSYDALSARLCFNVRAYRMNAWRAREILRRNGDAVIDVGEHGFRRLTDAEVVNIAAPRYKQKARAAIGRGAGSLTSVSYDALSDNDKRSHNMHLSMFGALRLVFSSKARRALEKAVGEANAKLPERTALKLFDSLK